MFTKGFDIRDLACDGYGFTAEQSGMNRFKGMAPDYVQKINDKIKLEKTHNQQKDEKDEREIHKEP